MQHEHYMTRALDLAERGRYTASPNPMVGCVLVKDDAIIGEGYHVATGGPHAEIAALTAAGAKAQGATAYVSLEPCCHHGKTPPCTLALQAAGIKTVYAATLDPNPLVAGKGIVALNAMGITTHVGLQQKRAEQINEIFFYAMRHYKPFVIAKWAMSLDGKTITQVNDARTITGEDTAHAVHALRQQVDAILVGAHTARYDNPLLTVRHLPDTAAFIKQPLRIVLSSDADLPLDLNLFSSHLPGQTLVVTTTQAAAAHCDRLRSKNIEVRTVEPTAAGQVDLNALLAMLWERGITSLLVEGGAKTHAAFFAEHLVNKVEAYIAPVIISELTLKVPVRIHHVKQTGHDFHFAAALGEN